MISRSFSSRAFLQLFLIDGLLYGLLFWRDYTDPAQMLIAHYISFVAVTDLAVFFLPAEYRRWFNCFRLSSALAFLVLVVALHAKGLDGASLALTLARAAMVIVRLCHAAVQLRAYGPDVASLIRFPETLRCFYRDGSRSERLGCAYLLVGLGLLYFPQLGYWTHYNGGQAGLDDILTGSRPRRALTLRSSCWCSKYLWSLRARAWVCGRWLRRCLLRSGR